MYYIDIPKGVAVEPLPALPAPPGWEWFQDSDPTGSTPFSADWCNTVQKELITVVINAGLTPNKADRTQLYQAIGGAAALMSHATDTGPVTTHHTRAVLASDTSRSVGANSLVSASTASTASGARSHVTASHGCSTGGAESFVAASDTCLAPGGNAAVLASTGLCSASGTSSMVAASDGACEASGLRSAIVASDGACTATGQTSWVAASTNCDATFLHCAVIASQDCISSTNPRAMCLASITSIASGAGSLVAACGGAGASGLSSAAIASGAGSLASGGESAVLASHGAIASGQMSSAIGCDGTSADGNQCVAAACAGGTINGYHTGALAVDMPFIKTGAENCAVLASAIGSIDENAAGDVAESCIVAGTTDGKIFGPHKNCASIATRESTVVGTPGSGVYAVHAATDVADHCAVIASKGSYVSPPAPAGTGIVGAVVIASVNVENSVPYSLAGGVSAVAFTPTGATQNNTWRIESGTGNIFIDGVVGGPADYAECMENEISGVLPVGSLIARRGEKVHLAEKGERAVGVISARPGVIGNNPVSWRGRYQTDDFGARIMEQVETPAQTREVPAHQVEVEGQVIDVPARTLHTPAIRYMAPKQAEAHDPTRPYQMRTDRPGEWTVVGILGQIRTRVDAAVQADDFVVPGASGVGTRSDDPGRGRRIECMRILSAFDADRGYAIALCLVG